MPHNKDASKIEKIRHSLSHLMSMAVLEFYPEAKLGIGPVIENGFYYDFDFSRHSRESGNLNPLDPHFRGDDDKFSENDLPKIEKKIKELIKKNLEFKKEEISYKQAKEIFKDQLYKLELIEELATKDEKNSPIFIYKTLLNNKNGKPEILFTDLCAGPHVEFTKEINPSAFKLTRIAGAYWRGDEKNKMLTRIYGIAYDTKEELQEYEKKIEEALKRDHRKLGKELDLFVFSDLVGPGLPLYAPKGTIIIEELKKHIEKVCLKYGFEKVITPHLAKIDLYEVSGHAKKFKEELFHVTSEKKHEFVLKPVQCPHQTQIYASQIRSYRDLPIRYMESEKQYRAEQSGEVGGLNRVYAITVEDGHSFCAIDQIKDEVISMVGIIQDFYGSLGLSFDSIDLSVRDSQHPEKYIGEPKDWDVCEKMLQEISNEMNLGAKKAEGEAALYGPKLDFKFKDALGKEIQIPTVQLDFATPKRFNLSYIDKNGEEKNPVMVHRAVLGSYERFLALLIEHFAGAFPFWLSPIQVKILSVGENHIEYTKNLVSKKVEITEELKDNNKDKKNTNWLSLKDLFRVDIDESNNTLGKKIREAEKEKIPFIIVIGDKEMESGDLAVRERGSGEIKNISLDKFISKCKGLLPET